VQTNPDKDEVKRPAAFPIPEVFTRGELDCYLDGVRGYLVQATPEEAVRQQTVKWLTDELGVPKHLIRTEFNHQKHGGKGRSDILILHPSGDEDRGILVVECKRPEFPLEERAQEQATRYASQVCAPFCALTNGEGLLTLHQEQSGSEWRKIHTPTWSEMLSGKLKYVRSPAEGQRWEWEHFGTKAQMRRRLRDSKDLLECVVGEDSEWYVGAFACNLYDLLVYERNAFCQPIEDSHIALVKDLGIHDRYFGNAAGGSWESDVYRSFLVFDKRRNTHQVVSLLVSSSMKTTNHPVFKNSAGRTYLVVAVDEGSKSHLSLQASLDATLTEHNFLRGEVNIRHNGSLTVGHRGPAPRNKVLQFVSAAAPHLVSDGGVLLGNLPADRLIRWCDAAEFLLRVTNYALIRDEFREIFRQ
jgi:hypothetical protein